MRLPTAIRMSLGMFALQSFMALPAAANDYPTKARVDYVLACLADNAALPQCVCTIDAVASQLPYDDYVAAETVLRMRKMNGEKGSLFRETKALGKITAALKSAEDEAKGKCF